MAARDELYAEFKELGREQHELEKTASKDVQLEAALAGRKVQVEKLRELVGEGGR